MESIENYSGAVLFVDILGISALTNGIIKLEKKDFEPWLYENKKQYKNQFLGAAILTEFRRILMELDEVYKNITITQLSDCAFIWSRNLTDILIFASNFMHKSVNRGILCRGGISYGEIIETSQSHRLGRFILGDAVTTAAKLESRSKGCRILVSQNVHNKLWKENKNLSNNISAMIQPFTNPIDYSVFDEFKWYLAPPLNHNNEINVNSASINEKIAFTKQRLILGNIIRCSPKFNWNSKNSEGLQQLRASINFLTENKLLDILHNFDHQDVISNRDEAYVTRQNDRINNYRDYRKIEPDIFPDDWDE